MALGRRDVLKAGAVLGGATGIIGAPPLLGSKRQTVPGGRAGHILNHKLLNDGQSQAVMEEYDLAGMIALDPVNVYYLSNTATVAMRFGINFSAAATLPRDPSQPTFLISGMGDRSELANGDHWAPAHIPVSSPIIDPSADRSDPKFLLTEPSASNSGFFANPEARLSEREKRWVEARETKASSATLEWGIARALRESGITRGRVAVDDLRIKDRLASIGIGKNLEFVDGEQHFRRIRYVKSATEIALLRLASVNNARAAVEAAKAVQLGMTAEDLEFIFNEKAANYGNRMKFFIAGFPLSGFPNRTVEKGKPFAIDAVSGLHGYLGDFGRTVVLGEPDRFTRSMVTAQSAAREAINNILKPGTKYSEIRATGADAFKKAGGDSRTFYANPHSVGLQHTDQPFQRSGSGGMPEDLVLKSGMTITVDLPYVEIGVGAGHHEDMILITESGFEKMNDSLDDIVIV